MNPETEESEKEVTAVVNTENDTSGKDAEIMVIGDDKDSNDQSGNEVRTIVESENDTSANDAEIMVIDNDKDSNDQSGNEATTNVKKEIDTLAKDVEIMVVGDDKDSTIKKEIKIEDEPMPCINDALPSTSDKENVAQVDTIEISQCKTETVQNTEKNVEIKNEKENEFSKDVEMCDIDSVTVEVIEDDIKPTDVSELTIETSEKTDSNDALSKDVKDEPEKDLHSGAKTEKGNSKHGEVEKSMICDEVFVIDGDDSDDDEREKIQLAITKAITESLKDTNVDSKNSPKEIILVDEDTPVSIKEADTSNVKANDKDTSMPSSSTATETKIEAKSSIEIPEKTKDVINLVDNQVQCVNLHCQSGYDLGEAPVFVLTYFGVPRRKNVVQKVCRECFQTALKHQENLASLLEKQAPLLSADFPSQKDNVVVMDSVDEIYEEDILPDDVIAEVETHLLDVLENVYHKYDIDYQIKESQRILDRKYDQLEVFNQSINQELNEMDRKLMEVRNMIYKEFTPHIKELPSLNIIEPREKMIPKIPLAMKRITKQRVVATKKVTYVPKCVLPPTYFAPKEAPATEIVAVKEIEVPQSQVPPIGPLTYPKVAVGDQVLVMKHSFFGVWMRGRITEIPQRAPDGSSRYRIRLDYFYRSGYSRVMTGKQMAYIKPSPVRYPVGTRVVAIFQSPDSKKEAYYVGIIAEPPKHLNKFRYLVFFDDGYAQYVIHEKIRLVCEASRQVYEDIHPDSKDFIKKYLDQYPERPMVKLQQGQVVRTEWNGKWWIARAIEIDGSLAKMHFDADGRTEWIYRGSTRLGPLYAELVAAAARKEQGGLSRHRSLGIASLKKRNMPYVEYSVEQDEAKTATAMPHKNVAKKSTTSRSASADTALEKPLGPPRPFEKMEHTTKGYIRPMDLSNRIPGRVFTPHQCNLACIEWTKFHDADCRGICPLAIPLLFGFERQITQSKGKRSVMYRGPCGRRIRNMDEMHRYLRITKSKMGLDYFDFDYWIQVLDEFFLDQTMYCTYLKDLSYGRENTPVSCVNEINHSWPLFMEYSTCRIPQDGVNICLNEEFLVCCDCTDDCQDKEKCPCWQLTIEGTKLGPEGEADPTVGYHYKRLPEPVTTGIYECNSRCKCASTCLNRVAQHPLQLNLQVFKTLKKGWGIRTLNDIPHGSFICIYAGRLLTEQSANDGGRMYGDEYLAELDYIEVVEGFKEGYESDVVEPDEDEQKDRKTGGDKSEESEEQDDDEERVNSDDQDYVPMGLNRYDTTESIVNTRAQKKKTRHTDKKTEKETVKNGTKSGKKSKQKATGNKGENSEMNMDEEMAEDDEDREFTKKPSKFNAEVPVDRPRKHKSVREMFGDGADDCYIMDAKLSGNIGRYLNHSCKPNVFVQNVFVDTHDVRFPWVAFFALSYIKAGSELTWDYNYDVGSVPDKVLYCYCNNADCRGRLL